MKYKLYKNCFLILLPLFFRISAFAQSAQLTEKIDLHLHRTNAKAVIEELDRQSTYSFTFAQEQLSRIDIQKFNIDGNTLGETLNILHKQLGLEFDIRDGNISVKSGLLKPATPLPPAKGILKGRIVDFESSQPLPGATVTIQETGRSVLSDEKGYYLFNGLSDSTYTLTVTYTGYQKYYQPGIEMKDGKIYALDVKMQAGTSLDEVVVQSGAHKVKTVTHTTEKQLVLEIRNATGVLSGISNELIAKTGDRNAAEVVKRIPGVTVVDNRLVVVRGMNERYNLTYLNGNLAPSTEYNSKAFAYDLLPSSIIDRIIVYKSPRADLNGEFAGAAIKIYTRNAMPVKHFDIGVQVAHRPGSTMTNVNSYQGGKLDWLGIDDGTRKLPGFSPGYFQSGKTPGNISQGEMVRSFSPTLSYYGTTSTPDMQFYANYYNSFRLGSKLRLFDLTSVTYTKETTSYNVYRQTGNTDTYIADGGYNGIPLGEKNKIENDQQTTEIGKINLLENLTLHLNPKNSIQFKNFLVNDGRRFTGIDDSRLNALPRYGFLKNRKKDIILSFQQRFLYSGNLGGKHEWGKLHQQELEWNLGYTRDLQDVPDQRISHFATTGVVQNSGEIPSLAYYAAGTNAGGLSDGEFGMISRLFIRQIEQNYNGSIDYTYTINPSWRARFGTFQLFKTRELGRRFFRVNRGGLGVDEVVDPLSNGADGWVQGFGLIDPGILYFHLQDLGKIWNPANFPQDGSGLGVYDATSPTDRYVATEQNNSFYGMSDWQTRNGRFLVNGGVRIEYDRQKIAGAAQNNFGFPRVAYAVHPKTSVLPSLNLTWRPGPVFVARASYGRTVNRPEFSELAPYDDYDYLNQERIRGDPEIISATIDNYDLRLELYPHSQAGNEMIDIGAFYKYIKDPIEKFRLDVTGLSDDAFSTIFFGNSAVARVYGLEAEIKKNLSFIGGNLFRRLSIVVNGTRAISTTRQKELKTYGAGSDYNLSVKGRPLQGQSPYVFNAGLFYEHPGSGTKIGLTYNVNGPVIYAKSIQNPLLPSQHSDSVFRKSFRPDLLQLPIKLLDFSVTQRIVRSLQAKFSIQNLLDQSYRIVEDQNYNQKYDPEYPVYNANGERYYKGDNIYRKYNPGRYFLLSFTYAF